MKHWRNRNLSLAGASLVALIVVQLMIASPASATPGGAVSGVVRGETGSGTYAPLGSVRVEMMPLSGPSAGHVVATATTTGAGTYSITTAEVGDYRLRFRLTSAAPTHFPIWLGDSPYRDQSAVLHVTSAASTGVDAQMGVSATLSGTITRTGTLAAPTTVSAHLWNPMSGQFETPSVRATASSNGLYTLQGLAPGRYLIRFGDSYAHQTTSTEYWSNQTRVYRSDLVSVADQQAVTVIDSTIGTGTISVTRLSGVDRWETSVAMSVAGFTANSGTTINTPAAIISNGLNFPDALGAGPAAARIGAPLLLVDPTSIPQVVKNELTRLKVPSIIIIGSESAVSAALEVELATYAPNVVRISGSSRYETSAAIADYFFGADDVANAYVATGLNYPDALAAGPAAANEFAPVLLQDATTVDDPFGRLIAGLTVDRVVIAGGTAGVSQGLEDSLFAQPSVVETVRRAGVDRYDTGVKINQGSFEIADTVIFATGLNYPDALSGAALAGAWLAPIYLVPQNCVPPDVLLELDRLQTREVVLLGGTTGLGAGVASLTPC